MERIQFLGGEALAASPEHLASLAAKLHAAQGHIGAVAKDGRNERFNYNYVSYEALAAEVRQALKKAGLAFFVSMDEPQFSEIKTERSTMTRALVGGAITFMDTDTGAMLSVPWYGEGTDTMDKATAKALTAGVKYLLMRTFLVSDQEDVDGDTEPPAPRQAQQRRGDGEAHWLQVKARRERFLTWAREERSLSVEDVIRALGVKALAEYRGTPEQAKDAIEAYTAAQ